MPGRKRNGLLKDHMQPIDEKPPKPVKPQPIAEEKPPVNDAAQDTGEGNGNTHDNGNGNGNDGMILLGLFALVICSFSLLRD
jgi:hypothetical protein